MANRDNILNELSLLNSTLGKLSPENLYKVPEGYFEGLAAEVMGRIKALHSSEIAEELEALFPELNNIPRNLPYSTPSGYFEGLEEKLMQFIREHADYQSPQEELESVSPLLGGLKKQNPYTVPAGYFETFAKKKPAVKVISITDRKWFRFAAAALVIGIISTGAIFYLNGKSNSPADENKAWAKIEKKVENLSDKEIKDFVEFSEAGLSTSETAGLQPIKKDEVRELLMDVSDSELREFLEQTSGGVDDILLSN